MFLSGLLARVLGRRELLPSGDYCAVLSLGKKCQPAGRLKRLGLRTFSGPFDWFANQTLPEVHFILRHGTAHIFRPENTTRRGTHNEYAVFRDRRTKFVSMHDIKIRDLAKGEAACLADMVRKIERRRQAFLETLAGSERVLLVRLNGEAGAAATLRTYLSACYPRTIFEILIVTEVAGQPIRVHRTGEPGIHMISGDNTPSGEEWLGSDILWHEAMKHVRLVGQISARYAHGR